MKSRKLHLMTILLSAVSICLVLSVAAWAQEGTLKVGSNTIELQVGGKARSYIGQVPNSYELNKPVPLVVVLHGTGGTPKRILSLGHFYKYVELKGFIAVAPSSLGHAFNEGAGRGGPEVKEVDDVAFIEAVIDDVRKRAEIDPARIFLAGFSSGASMAQRVALESSYDIAAVVAPAGHLWAPERTPARARPLLLMWGTADKLNPMQGGKVPYRRSGVTLDKPGPIETAAGWARRLGCKSGPHESTPSEGVRKMAWKGCNEGAVVELYLVEALGHHWGGGRPLPVPDKWIGPYSDRINTTELMWDFFQRHSR